MIMKKGSPEMRQIRLFVLASVLLALPGCVKLTLAWADLSPDGQLAAPVVLDDAAGGAPITTVERWENERAPALREAFQAHIYGYLPDAYDIEVLSRTVLDDAAFDGVAQLIEYKLQAHLKFGDETQTTKTFYMNVAAPNDVENAPIILMQTFCPRWDTLPHPQSIVRKTPAVVPAAASAPAS